VLARGSDPASPGERPPEPPAGSKAPFLRHGVLALLARGSDPPEPPAGSKAPFLRHGVLALSAWEARLGQVSRERAGPRDSVLGRAW
jgi:hypothetical protein